MCLSGVWVEPEECCLHAGKHWGIAHSKLPYELNYSIIYIITINFKVEREGSLVGVDIIFKW